MTNAAAATKVQWLFDEEATQFLEEKGASDNMELQTLQHIPDVDDWVSWPWIASNQPFEVTSRWFIWTADREPVVQIFLAIPQMG